MTDPAGPTRLDVGIGTAASGLADVVLDVGPQHPAAHGALRLALTLDGPRIVAADPIVGHLHRGAEKLFEVRDYRQIITLANRHDWLSSYANEIGVVLAVERMMGIEVPERALWLRTLLAELTRVASHLVFLGGAPVGADAVGVLPTAWAERERLVAVMEQVSGGRLHYMLNRVGGLVADVPAGWPEHARRAVTAVRARLPELTRRLAEDEDFVARTRGVGVLPPEVVGSYGVSGPLARASGVDLDLRRDDPYLAYPHLAVPVVTRTAGDCEARFACLCEEVAASLDLTEQCLDRLPAGAIDVRLPKTVKAPEGTTYAWTENPLGIMGYYLVSRGERTPWRLKMRTASFNNVSALAAMLPGTRLPDLVTILSSTFFVSGDIDK